MSPPYFIPACPAHLWICCHYSAVELFGASMVIMGPHVDLHVLPTAYKATAVGSMGTVWRLPPGPLKVIGLQLVAMTGKH